MGEHEIPGQLDSTELLEQDRTIPKALRGPPARGVSHFGDRYLGTRHVTASALLAFADELEKFAGEIMRYRFRDADRYVCDVDEVRRRISGFVDRMRRAASEKPVERGALPPIRRPITQTIKTRDGHQVVRVEPRRRRRT